jgi:hypothetical protein
MEHQPNRQLVLTVECSVRTSSAMNMQCAFEVNLETMAEGKYQHALMF